MGPRQIYAPPFLMAILVAAAAPACTCDGGALVTTGCGNGIVEPDEDCDVAGTRGEDAEGCGACHLCHYITAGCCGNGRRDFDEECDGDELFGQTCETLELGEGTLACGAECGLDTTGCTCGNGQRDAGEDCDGDDLGDATCASLGHPGPGVLTCSRDCHLNDSQCQGSCGNGLVEGAEECDGDPEDTCEDRDMIGGPVLCDDCHLDFGNCRTCGNGQVDLPLEDCDIGWQTTCEAAGRYGTAPVPCDPVSCTWDISGCSCGNGVIDEGEECDPEGPPPPRCDVLGYDDPFDVTVCDACVVDTSVCCEAVDEVCDNGLDDDCDGDIDEECACPAGAVQRCWDGAAPLREVGACHDGQQVCGQDGWGPCLGAVHPVFDECNAIDDDCDGETDENQVGCDQPRLHCLDGDDALPLREYALDAAALYDGVPSSCAWEIECPLGGDCPLPADADACSTTVYFTVSGDYHVTANLTDEDGFSITCSWVVHVAGTGLRVELRWVGDGGDESDDLDLHLHREVDPQTAWFNDDDCSYINCRSNHTIDWGYPNTPIDACPVLPPEAFWVFGADGCPSPRLDIDDVQGFGPENISVDAPAPGDAFRIMVNHFDDEQDPATASAWVRIYCGGELRSEFGPATLSNVGPNQGDLWRVADVVYGNDDCDIAPLVADDGSYDVQGDASRAFY